MLQHLSVKQNSTSRPLRNLETFFKVLADVGKPLRREHWTIHMTLHLAFPASVSDPTAYLRRAWQVLHYQHPALGAVTSQNNSTAYITVEKLDEDVWANNTFTVYPDYKGTEELFSCLYPTATATCYWLPTPSKLVIRSSHWRIDGVGMAMLSHDFMVALAAVLRLGHDASLDSLMPGLEHRHPLAPSLEELALAQSRFPKLPKGEENPILATGADNLVARFLRGVPSIGLPTRPNSEQSNPGASGCAVTHLDAVTTVKIRAACRNKNIKVTSAIHAAIIRVTSTFPQHPLSKSYAAFVPIDLRRALDITASSEVKTLSKVVGLYFSGLPVCVDSVLPGATNNTKTFEDVARDLDAVYGSDILQFWGPDHENTERIGLLDLVEPYVRRTTALFGAHIPEGFPPVQTPDLSTLGKVDMYLQKYYDAGEHENVEVIDFWLGTEMLNRSVQFHTWSWKDEFNLGACFNLSFYDNEFIIDVLNKVIDGLLVGCGISK
ncbi:uncharacterized protein F4822DRAFT_438651 [Hypoxylon trugodes]|uniref:uncharacterized protein n=1 Tax=Hypoxylon trugodes TaxID=326681 RepID=UPI0021991EB3|nr:uncharacterized protein F4822DRAFT_438651 [Hypoxylon trugodes]KAI1383836.1 hypothetical protein F4822DRAFT_438651 [Hypoxylon trugodes]